MNEEAASVGLLVKSMVQAKSVKVAGSGRTIVVQLHYVKNDVGEHVQDLALVVDNLVDSGYEFLGTAFQYKVVASGTIELTREIVLRAPNGS